MSYRMVIALVAAFAAIFGYVGNKVAEKHPRKEDMHLPARQLGQGIGATGGGIALAVYGVVTQDFVLPMIFGAVLLVFGIAAVLCWKNQTITMLDDERFVYRTMFGNEHEHRFSDIVNITRRKNDRTLIMRDGSKVFLESSAEMSDRLRNAIAGAFKAQLEAMGAQIETDADGKVTVRMDKGSEAC